MHADLPPIAKAAERLTHEIYKAVRAMARVDKYDIGVDLRKAAKDVWCAINDAWRDRARQAEHLDVLTRRIDALRFTLQVAHQLHAFRSWHQFDMLIRLAEALGKQAGGWRRQQHRNGQNPARATAPERASILSTSAAPVGANP